MSHIVSIQTEVRDLVAVRSACERLKLPQPTHGTFKLFTSTATWLGVQLPSGGIRWSAIRPTVNWPTTTSVAVGESNNSSIASCRGMRLRSADSKRGGKVIR